jgi:hypothetical protein
MDLAGMPRVFQHHTPRKRAQFAAQRRVAELDGKAKVSGFLTKLQQLILGVEGIMLSGKTCKRVKG